jgi:hypothetical protein
MTIYNMLSCTACANRFSCFIKWPSRVLSLYSIQFNYFIVKLLLLLMSYGTNFNVSLLTYKQVEDKPIIFFFFKSWFCSDLHDIWNAHKLFLLVDIYIQIVFILFKCLQNKIINCTEFEYSVTFEILLPAPLSCCIKKST